MIFWPGLIVGILMTFICCLAFMKRKRLSQIISQQISQLFGSARMDAETIDSNHTLIIPLLGGIGLGVFIFIFSLFGLMK